VGLEFHEIAAGLATFAGVRRRREVRGEAGGVVVIDDFAHHPTAVGRRSTPSGPVPGAPAVGARARSNTCRRRVHQAEYVEALSVADLVA
jgi:UDP-N-acetylmuramate: L-alanyl-gamma-D-glutamyl-meso-diaminopimelate ligase